MQDMQELALEAVRQRLEGNGSHFGAIALELEVTVGKGSARRLIERAERELGVVAPAATAAQAIHV